MCELQSGDEGVALESCEFWSAFCEAAVSQPDRLNPEILRPFLGRLVPVLLKNMVSRTCTTPRRTQHQEPCPKDPTCFLDMCQTRSLAFCNLSVCHPMLQKAFAILFYKCEIYRCFLPARACSGF